jgi:hypothetical protein
MCRAIFPQQARQLAWGKKQIGKFNSDVVERSKQEYTDELKRRDEDSDSDAEYDEFEAVAHDELVMTNFDQLKHQDTYVDTNDQKQLDI